MILWAVVLAFVIVLLLLVVVLCTKNMPAESPGVVQVD
jgi:hypothetical protein